MRISLITALISLHLAVIALSLPGSSHGAPKHRDADPAPGRSGAYLGHSPDEFYNIDGRIARIEQRAASLGPDQRGRALKMIQAVRTEQATRRKRKGELSDWDIEHLNHRLDEVVRKFPELAP